MVAKSPGSHDFSSLLFLIGKRVFVSFYWPWIYIPVLIIAQIKYMSRICNFLF